MMDRWKQLLQTLSGDCRRAMEFLYEHLPLSDLDCYPADLFLRFAKHAVQLRRSVPWCAALEQEIFDHYVLFPRVNDEDLSFHREAFYEALMPLVQNLQDPGDRILAVNRWCHEIATYEMQDDRTASPLTVFRSGSGRCGEESAFLTAALRSVGIPARQVYVPRWAHCDDNHAWVEAWCQGQWRFLGACEPEPVLDRGWFNTPASRAMLVHSRIFGEGTSSVHGEFLGRQGGVCWFNQTARYAAVERYGFQVLIDNGEAGAVPAAFAKLQIQLLNEAGFHTIAALTADENGKASVTLGLGDARVFASLGDMYAEENCVPGESTLYLKPCVPGGDAWEELDFFAPRSKNIHPAVLDEKQKAARASERQRGDALRSARIAALGCDNAEKPEWVDLLRLARGNCGVIRAFLEADGDPLREKLLRTLGQKDLRDVTEETLQDHFCNAPDRGSFPENIYLSCVLCPRVEWEPLSPWRGALGQILTPAQKAGFQEDPAGMWEYLKENIHTHVERTYSNLVWTPLEAWRSKRCSERSLRILFVALLRTLGVPARLRPLDEMPEFWQNGVFCPVVREERGTLSLHCAHTPLYRQNWTLSRWTESGWQELSLDDKDWENGLRTITLPAGQYRLCTSIRLPNGNQHAYQRNLTILPGNVTACDLRLRAYGLEDVLGCQELPVMSAFALDGTQLADLRPQRGNPALLLWLEEGGEPTEHLLHELSARQGEMEALGADIVFLLRGRKSLQHPTLARLLKNWARVRVLFDDWQYDLEHVARCLTCDPDSTPLAVVCDREGNAVYGSGGYRVGGADILLRILEFLSKAE